MLNFKDLSVGNLISIGLLVWSMLNLVQAYHTGLSHDEAYYWMYSQNIDWGYFDHPPAIALIIRVGYLFFTNEMGVRLLTVVLSTFTIFLLYKICQPKKEEILIFFTIIFSIPLVHVGGFLATPDIPFIFFTTLFFWIYKKYLIEDSWRSAFLLAFIMAAIMYSKYHGVLVIGLTIFSNINLLSRKSFWASGILALVLFLPHLYWQYSHDFVTFKYHLFERLQDAYKIEYTVEYLLGQIAVAGPLTAIILFISAYRAKLQSSFYRALKFNLLGILIFFFINSFKSTVEANWTAGAFIPLIILAFYGIQQQEPLRKWFLRLAAPAIILLLIARVVLMMNTLPFNYKVKSEFFLWNKWANKIKEKANGAPVIFMNSYQKASKYIYYTNERAHSLNNFMYRKNQYDIWPIEDSLQGKKVMLIPNYELGLDTFNTSIEKYNYVFIENFRSFNKVRTEIIDPTPVSFINDTLQLAIKLINNGSYDADFSANPALSSQLSVNFYLKGEYQSTQLFPIKQSVIKRGEACQQNIIFTAPSTPEKYKYRIAIVTGTLPYGLNSDLYSLEVKRQTKGI